MHADASRPGFAVARAAMEKNVARTESADEHNLEPVPDTSAAAMLTNIFDSAMDVACNADQHTSDFETVVDVAFVDGGGVIGMLGETLGTGRMGRTRKMRIRDSDVVVAAKYVRSDGKWSKERRNDFETGLMREALICFSLGRSPLIASIYDVLVPLPGRPIPGTLLICELGDKGDLRSMMGDIELPYRGPCYLDENVQIWSFRSIALQMFLGLDHMHSRGVFHQDYNPSNILLCGNGLVKIVDFGECVVKCGVVSVRCTSIACCCASGMLECRDSSCFMHRLGRIRIRHRNGPLDAAESRGGDDGLPVFRWPLWVLEPRSGRGHSTRKGNTFGC